MSQRFFVVAILMIVMGWTVSVAQQRVPYQGMQFKTGKVERVDGSVCTTLSIVLDEVRLHRQNLITLTPKIVSLDGLQSYSFAPIVVGSRTSLILLERGELGLPQDNVVPGKIVRRKRGPQEVEVELSAPFSVWMRNSKLDVEVKAVGCAMCEEGFDEFHLLDRFLPEAYKPELELAYIVPTVEPVKKRADRFIARLNFEVARYEVLKDFSRNTLELERVDSVVKSILNNEAIKVSDVTIDGYASPEGDTDSNIKLSRNRAQAFVNYLVRHYGLDPSFFNINGRGEDWRGLVEKVKQSSLENKEKVLELIGRYELDQGREAQLVALDNGETYNYMLQNFYPPLRRTEYTFNYSVRAFNVEEARNIIKVKPILLSLNEMYLVAESYPQNSRAREEVLEIAARVFPDNEVSRLNLFASQLNAGRMDADVEHGLLALKDMPEALNNLGVLYARRGELEKAFEYFQKANKLKVAADNAREIQKQIKDR